MPEIKWIYSEKMVNTINKISYPILVLTGPSGAGKSTLACYLESKYGNTFTVVRNYTTRAKRNSDKLSHFKYISDTEFEVLEENNEIFFARSMEFPFYGYLNKDLSIIMNMRKIPLFMVRARSLAKMLDLLNNVYVINIYSDSELTQKYSRNEIKRPTAEIINETQDRIELICKQKAADRSIKIYNNYDDSFFNNPALINFIEKIKEDKGRFTYKKRME